MYIPTDEGRLYLDPVMDLCGRKFVGMSIDSRMTKQLTIDALNDAVNHSGDVNGCIWHSDMGSRYCRKRVHASYDYMTPEEYYSKYA